MESMSFKFIDSAFWLAVVLVFASCASDDSQPSGDFPPPALPPSAQPEPKPKSRLFDNSVRVGDSLEIFVKEDNQFDGIYLVRERGDIIIPRVGRIPVAGMSVTAAGTKIEAALESNQLTEATLIVDRVRRAKVESQDPVRSDPRESGQRIMVYMTGKVNRPGQHVLTIPKGRTLGVYEAILISGGMTRFGNDEKVHVLRMGEDGKRHRIPVNVRMIEQGKAVDPTIGHGDVVVVPEKVFGY